MVGEQANPELALVVASGTPETKVESTMMAVEIAAVPAESVAVNPTEESDDSGDIDIEEDNTIIHPTKPSHVEFGKSKIKSGHIEVLTKSDYIDNVDWVRLGGEDMMPKPREGRGCCVSKLFKGWA